MPVNIGHRFKSLFMVIVIPLFFILFCDNPVEHPGYTDNSDAADTFFFIVYDEPDSESDPDFKELLIGIHGDSITINLTLWRVLSDEIPGSFIYLYGSYRDLIDFNLDSFNIRRDPGGDGHFEVTIIKDSMSWIDSATCQFSLDTTIFPDIMSKSVWAYSMASDDRIPDQGSLQIGADNR